MPSAVRWRASPSSSVSVEHPTPTPKTTLAGEVVSLWVKTTGSRLSGVDTWSDTRPDSRGWRAQGLRPGGDLFRTLIPRVLTWPSALIQGFPLLLCWDTDPLIPGGQLRSLTRHLWLGSVPLFIRCAVQIVLFSGMPWYEKGCEAVLCCFSGILPYPLSE